MVISHDGRKAGRHATGPVLATFFVVVFLLWTAFA